MSSKYFILVLSLFNLNTLNANEWKWTGFEVIGSRSASRGQIISDLSIKSGDTYIEDQPQWQTWCEQIKKKFDFYYTDCSSVRFADYRAFLVINIVEHGQEYQPNIVPHARYCDQRSSNISLVRPAYG